MKVKASRAEDLPPGRMIDLQLEGRRVLMANVEGELFAMDGLCSHRGGVLAKGTLDGHVVKCPKHGTEYDLRTGKVVRNVRIPLIGKAVDLSTYEVSVEEGDVLVDI